MAGICIFTERGHDEGRGSSRLSLRLLRGCGVAGLGSLRKIQPTALVLEQKQGMPVPGTWMLEGVGMSILHSCNGADRN